MSLMVDQLWVRSRMSLSITQADGAVDTEFVESMSAVIAARRATVVQQQQRHTGRALVRRDTDEELFTMMAELIETHDVMRRGSGSGSGSLDKGGGEDADEALLNAMDGLIDRVWEKRHGSTLALAGGGEDEELIDAMEKMVRKSVRGKGRGPGRSVARADEDDDDDDMGGSQRSMELGGIVAPRNQHRAARPQLADQDSFGGGLGEQAEMELGLAADALAAAAAGPRRRGGAKAAVGDTDDTSVTHDDMDEVVLGSGWLTHGAVPNKVRALARSRPISLSSLPPAQSRPISLPSLPQARLGAPTPPNCPIDVPPDLPISRSPDPPISLCADHEAGGDARRGVGRGGRGA